MQLFRCFFTLFILFAATGCNFQNSDTDIPVETPVSVDRDLLLSDLEYLASDELEGRRVGTAGNRLAQTLIGNRFASVGLASFGETYRQPFDHNLAGSNETVEAVNLAGFVEGQENPDRYIAVIAHYDHLGTQNGEIFNGADDNASGTAGLLAAARWFADNPPDNSILFIAFDAEEQGLAGARYFVNHPPVPLDQVKLVVNMDMISTNFENEIYAVGTHHYPWLRPMVEQSAAESPIKVLFGHDDPNESAQDWTLASDHGPFHQQGIPFTYFGVEDHPHYHQPTDTFETINPEFFHQVVLTVTEFVRDMDARLDEVVAASGR